MIGSYPDAVQRPGTLRPAHAAIVELAGVEQTSRSGRPAAGTLTVDGSRLDQMTEGQLAVWRGRTMVIVFVFFRLMPAFTAAEDAPLDPGRLGRVRERKTVVSRNLAAAGLGDRGDRQPLELSSTTRIQPGTALRYQ